MAFSRGPHLTVVVHVATLAVAHRPVAMVSTAAGREASDHRSAHVRTTVLPLDEMGKR